MPKQLQQLRQILWGQYANRRVEEAQLTHSLEWPILEKRGEGSLELFHLLAMGTLMNGNSIIQACLMMAFMKKWFSRVSTSTEATRTTTGEWTFQTVSQQVVLLLSHRSPTLKSRSQVCLSQISWDEYPHLVHQTVEASAWFSSLKISTKSMKW